MRHPPPDTPRRRGPRWPPACPREPLLRLRDLWLRLAGTRGRGGAMIAAAALAVTAGILVVQPWRALDGSTWICGQESGRIARNLCLGRGYSSPFATLYADTFAADDWAEAERIQAGAPEYAGRFGRPAPAVPQPGLPGAGPAPAPLPPTAWATPVSVYLWVALFWLFGVYSPAAMAAHLVLQVLFTAAAVYLLWRALHLELGPRPAAAALLMLLAYPTLWSYCFIAETHNTGLLLLLLAATLACLGRWRRTPGSGWLWPAGLCAALTVLADPSAILAVAAIVAWTGFSGEKPADAAAGPAGTGKAGGKAKRSLPRSIRPLAVAAVCAALVWGPWFVRNAAVFHQLVFFKSNLPVELGFGNTAGSVRDPVAAYMRRFPSHSESERRELLRLGEAGYGRRCRQEFLQFLRQRPGDAALLTARRVLYYWTYNPFTVNPWRPALTALFWFYLFLWLALRWKTTGRSGDGAKWRNGETATGGNGEAAMGVAGEVEHRTPNIERRTSNEAGTARRQVGRETRDHGEEGSTAGGGTRWLTGAGVLFLLLQPLAYYATHFMLYRYRLPLEVLVIVLVAAGMGATGETGKQGMNEHRSPNIEHPTPK